MELPSSRRKRVKKEVLLDNLSLLSESLGGSDLDRYLIQLRSKGLLDFTDCELINSKVTTITKVEAMVDILKTREGKKEEHVLDILIDVLNNGMHQNLARHLQRCRHRAMANERVIMGE